MNNWKQFYSPESLSKLLVSLIPDDFVPENVIDICAGSCNLLHAAKTRWTSAKYHASDINSIAEQHKFHNLPLKIDTLDALDIRTISSRYRTLRKKLLLANPPFGRSMISRTWEGYLDFPNLSRSIISLNRIECQIIISNISILETNDIFGAILPENIFSSERFQEFKYLFLSLFDNIIVKTNDIEFANSEVNTRLFIGRYKGSTLNKFIDQNPNASPSDLEENFPLVRGVDNSILIKNLENEIFPIRILHFNNIEGELMSFRGLSEEVSSLKAKIVDKNDLIILRVGRNSGRIITPDNRHFGHAVSDLMFILKNGKALGNERIKKLQELLLSRTKGLTTKYISRNDVYSSLTDILNSHCAQHTVPR